jgi:hypothetical protein
VRGECPLPFIIPPEKTADDGEYQVAPANPQDIQVALAALRRLPRRQGFPPWFPEEILARAEGQSASAN